VIKGTARYYNIQSSEIFSILKLDVKCVPKEISAVNNQEISSVFYLEALDPLVYDYKNFQVYP
jgi:hypothetical protein